MYRLYLHTPVCLSGLLLLANILNGQTISSYTTENSDLPGNIVKAVYVDEYGDKWFGTNNGLAMFDGDTWTIYTSESEHSIADNVINDVDIQVTDLHGSELWVGTTNGVTVAAFDVDGITAATSYRSSDAGVSLKSDLINAVAVDNKGTRYFGTDSGLAVFNASTWLYFDENSDPDIPGLEILSIDDDKDSIYIGLNGGSLANDEGVARIQNTVDGFTGATPYVVPYNIRSGKVFEVFVDSKGYRWFGTGYGTVRHTSITGKDFGRDMLLSSENGLAGDSVYAINEDIEKNMWFGTDQGVSKMNSSGVITNFTTADGLVSNIIYDIDFDRSNGTVWLATAGGVSLMENGFVSVHGHAINNENVLSIIPSVITDYAEIRFDVAANEYVELAVYNLNGQLIHSLFRGYMTRGEQVVPFNANSGRFARGIYIVRLTIRNNITSGKIVIL
jgi:ligand-binding sensor domain-containing protein